MNLKLRAYISHKNIIVYQGIGDTKTLEEFMFCYGRSKDIDVSTNIIIIDNIELYCNDYVIWQGTSKSGLEYKHFCKVVFDTQEWNSWSLECEDMSSGTVPIGFHGAKPNELTYNGNIYQGEIIKNEY